MKRSVTRRKDDRVYREIPVRWAIETQGRSGEGVLLDVSRSGARLRITSEFEARSGATFTLHAPTVPLLPQAGRLRWFRKLADQADPTYVCGLVFFELGTNLDDWNEWLRENP